MRTCQEICVIPGSEDPHFLHYFLYTKQTKKLTAGTGRSGKGGELFYDQLHTLEALFEARYRQPFVDPVHP